MEMCQNLTWPSWFTIFTAVLTVLALVGVVLNIKRKRACFYIWLFTNASWAVVDFYKGIPAQGLLFTIYTALAVWGILEWKEEGK
jgi:nicotinamide riboside transporter PnuC